MNMAMTFISVLLFEVGRGVKSDATEVSSVKRRYLEAWCCLSRLVRPLFVQRLFVQSFLFNPIRLG